MVVRLHRNYMMLGYMGSRYDLGLDSNYYRRASSHALTDHDRHIDVTLDLMSWGEKSKLGDSSLEQILWNNKGAYVLTNSPSVFFFPLMRPNGTFCH